LVCSGKVYYDLLDDRTKRGLNDVAIIRFEQLYPLNEEMVLGILGRYKNATVFGWVQEESQNMGAWSYIEPRLRALGYEFNYVGRDASASTATGSKKVHDKEQRELLEVSLTGTLPHMVRAPGARVPVSAPKSNHSAAPTRTLAKN
jgi:2-oxoglutarate dehydrogenase E1 component